MAAAISAFFMPTRRRVRRARYCRDAGERRPARSGSSCPTYNERENLEPLVARRARRARRRRRPTTRSWSWTTPRPTAPASSPTGSRATTRTCRSCTGPRKEGLGQAYLAGFELALRAGAELVLEMDADFSHDPGVPAADDRGRARRRPGARLALRAGRRRPQLGAGAPLREPRRLLVRAHGARRGRPRPDRRLQVLPAGGAGGDRPRARSARRATPSRSSSPTGRCSWASGSGRSRSCSPTGGWARARCRAGSCWRRCGWSPRCAGGPCPQARLQVMK